MAGKQLVPIAKLAEVAETQQPTRAGRRPARFWIAGYLQAHPNEDILDQAIADATGLPLVSVQKVLGTWARKRPDITREAPRTYRYDPQRTGTKVVHASPAASPEHPQWAWRDSGLRTASGAKIVADRSKIGYVLTPIE
jgi:hypothetical protein